MPQTNSCLLSPIKWVQLAIGGIDQCRGVIYIHDPFFAQTLIEMSLNLQQLDRGRRVLCGHWSGASGRVGKWLDSVSFLTVVRSGGLEVKVLGEVNGCVARAPVLPLPGYL